MQAHSAFGLMETHGMLAQRTVQRRLSSEGKGWSSLFASAQIELPFDGRFSAVDDQLIVWHRDGPVFIEGEGGARPFRKMVPADGIHLIPGGADFSIRLNGMLSTLHVYVRRKVLTEVAAEMVVGDPEAIEITPGVFDEERMLLALMRPVEIVLESDATDAGGLCGDYLALSLAAHLIERHSNARLKQAAQPRRPGHGVHSPTVDRAIAFMHDNLDAPIGLEGIAQAVERSASHVSRVFRSEIGIPPHRYLVQLRIRRAQELLIRTAMPIAEIAAECGFSHQEHLTHQFRRHLRTTPAAYRRAHRN